MLQQVDLTEVQGKFDELVDQVCYRGDIVVLMEGGKPAAAMIPFEWFARDSGERAAAFEVVDDVHSQNVDIAASEAELQNWISESVQEIRRQTK